MPHVDAGTALDRVAMATLLSAAGLPVAGLDAASELFVVREGERLVGCAAIELHADGGLLRSVTVVPAVRGTGIAAALVAAAIARAEALEVPALFLLTTTAERYFPRFGFEAIDRTVVPAGVRGSVEFTSACPATAVVMRKRLISD